jgi:hypothetical protein
MMNPATTYIFTWALLILRSKLSIPDKLIFAIKEINVSDVNAKIYQYKPLIKVKDSISPVPASY